MNNVGRRCPGTRGSSNSDSAWTAFVIACRASSRAMPCLRALAVHRSPTLGSVRHNLGQPPSGRLGRAVWREAGAPLCAARAC